MGVEFFFEGLTPFGSIGPIKSLINYSRCVRYRLDIGLNCTYSKSTSDFSRLRFLNIMGRSSGLPGVIKGGVVSYVTPSNATGRFRSLIRLIPSRFSIYIYISWFRLTV